MKNKFLTGNGVIYLWDKIGENFISKQDADSLISAKAGVVEGIYSVGKFYEDESHRVQITGKPDTIYMCLRSNSLYRYSDTLKAYIRLVSAITNGYFYGDTFYSDPDYKDKIIGSDGDIYIDLNTNSLFRYNGESEEYIRLTASGDGTDSTGTYIKGYDITPDNRLQITFYNDTVYTTPNSIQTVQGEVGPRGKSAYEVWLEQGNLGGTEDDFLQSITGPRGNQGVKGDKGDQGLTPRLETEDTSDGVTVSVYEDTALVNEFKVLHGRDGQNGTSVSDINYDNTEDTLTFIMSDGTSHVISGVKGRDGENGKDGETPKITYTEKDNGYDVSFATSAETKTINLAHGKDGKSIRHYWEGSTLYIESDSGADIGHNLFPTVQYLEMTDGEGRNIVIKDPNDINDPGYIIPVYDGRGITNVKFNDDYTLTLTYGEDAKTITTGSIRGAQGEQGATGNTGLTPVFRAGTITTLEPDKSASFTITGTPEIPYLNLSIPKGDKGDRGDQGERGEQGYPFLIYKEYQSISEFKASDFVEIGQMFMVKADGADTIPVYRFTGSETSPQYSLVTEISSTGIKGADGFSPTVTTASKDGVHTVTIKDANGDHSFTVLDGGEGVKGKDGVSIEHSWDGTKLIIKSASGESEPVELKGADGNSVTINSVTSSDEDNGDNVISFSDGSSVTIKNGKKGSDGVSVSHSWDGTTLTIVSASGTTSVDLKGEPGKDFTYDDFTPEQLEALKGENGENGKDYVLTDDDKNEIANLVYNSFAIAEEVGF